MLAIAGLNALDLEEFVSLSGNVVEKSPFIIVSLWKYRPFLSFEDLIAKLLTIIQGLPLQSKDKVMNEKGKVT